MCVIHTYIHTYIHSYIHTTYIHTYYIQVDVDANKKTAQACKISSMPTFQFYKQGKKVHEFSGADAKQIRDGVEKHQVKPVDPPAQPLVVVVGGGVGGGENQPAGDPGAEGAAGERKKQATEVFQPGDLVRLKDGLIGSTLMISERHTYNGSCSTRCLGSASLGRVGVIFGACKRGEPIKVASVYTSSKVLYRVVLYSKYIRALTFENLLKSPLYCRFI